LLSVFNKNFSHSLQALCDPAAAGVTEPETTALIIHCCPTTLASAKGAFQQYSTVNSI